MPLTVTVNRRYITRCICCMPLRVTVNRRYITRCICCMPLTVTVNRRYITGCICCVPLTVTVSTNAECLRTVCNILGDKQIWQGAVYRPPSAHARPSTRPVFTVRRTIRSGAGDVAGRSSYHACSCLYVAEQRGSYTRMEKNAYGGAFTTCNLDPLLFWASGLLVAVETRVWSQVISRRAYDWPRYCQWQSVSITAPVCCIRYSHSFLR